MTFSTFFFYARMLHLKLEKHSQMILAKLFF